jgi:hypothetical protein
MIIRFLFIMTITWSLSTVVGNNGIDNDKKCRESAGDFDHHEDAAVQCKAHCPMEHIPGFIRSHWMLPLGKCLCRIAPAATMVNKYVENTQNTNKKQFLASNYGTNRSLIVYENFILQKGPSTRLIDATSCVKMCDATIGAKELADISSYQMLSADKN